MSLTEDEIRRATEDFERKTGTKVPPPRTNMRPRVDFPPLSRRPTFICYDELFVANNQVHKAGVYYHYIETPKDDLGNETKKPVDEWICSVLKVVCIVRANAGNEHSYLIEYVGHGESAPRRTLLSQALLLGRADEPLKALRDLGVSVLRGRTKLVLEYLDTQHLRFSAQTPEDFWQSVKVVGWSPAPDCFVLPEEILGNGARVWFSGNCKSTPLYAKAGAFEDWKTNVASLCEKNSFLLLAVSSAFAGPLLELVNVPGIGFHLFGDSTNGKTTTLAAAASVWGPPEFLLSWRSTSNGLETQAANRSSTIILLDESHMVDAKTLDTGVYLLANGTSKSRMTKDISPREIARWRVCVLSSGERAIETHLSAAKIDHKTGQGIRIVDVPVSGDHGVFDDLHGQQSGSAFADKLREAAAKYYGHAGPLFVEQLIKELPALSLASKLAETMKDYGDDLNAQESRVARAFALVALAGELAAQWKVAPWSAKQASTAATDIFKLWRASQPSSPKGKEYAQIINGVREFIEVHGADFSDSEWLPEQDDKTSRIVNLEPVIRERAGYWNDLGAKRIYMFNADGVKRASGTFTTRKVIEVLKAAGAIADHDVNRTTKKCWIPQLKRSMDFYLIDPEKLELPR
jgi:putative DNA primase/helicase